MKYLILLAFFLFLPQIYAADRVVEMSWSPTQGATGYEVKLYKLIQGDEKEFSKEKVLSTVWSKSLASGDYFFQIRSLDYRGVAGPWGEKKFFKVSLPTVKQVSPSLNQGFDLIEDTDIPVTLVWEEIPEADRYNVKVTNSDGKILYDKNTTDTYYSFDFSEAGKYFWKVTALTSKDSAPAKVEFSKFFVLHPPKMNAPEVQFEVKDKYFSIYWDSSLNSSKDKINIFHRRNNRWIQIFKAEKKKIRRVNLDKTKIPKGKYKLKLVSFTDEGRASDPSTILFDWDQKELANIENKSGGAASFLSQNSLLAQQFGKTPWSFGFGMSSVSMDFTGIISENDTLVTSRFSGNNYHFLTERHFKDSPWSWQTDGWISSLVNAEDDWLLINVSSLANYKLGNKIHEFDLEVGATYRSLPYYDANIQVDNDGESTNISFLSVNLGGDYFYHLNDQVSLGGNLRLYLNTLALDHPRGAQMDMSTSSQFDLGLRYSISKDIFGHIRYGYLSDTLIFDGDEQTYDSNEFGLDIKIHF
jgi:hypothetical protein